MIQPNELRIGNYVRKNGYNIIYSPVMFITKNDIGIELYEDDNNKTMKINRTSKGKRLLRQLKGNPHKNSVEKIWSIKYDRWIDSPRYNFDDLKSVKSLL